MEISNTVSRREVFCRFIRKNGKIVYPKNARFFHFWVDDVPAEKRKCEQMSMFNDEQMM